MSGYNSTLSLPCSTGLVGAVKGMGLGVQHVISRPIKGVGLAGYSVWESLTSQEGRNSVPKCFMAPDTRFDILATNS